MLYNNFFNESKTDKFIKIVAFGDSLTEGYGISKEDSYPSQLQKILKEKNYNTEIINLGISGNTTLDGIARMQDVLNEKPQIVLLELGANDMLQGKSVADAEKNLEEMIKTFQKENIKIVLIGMKATLRNGFEYKKEFDKIYPKLAEKYNLDFVSFMLEGVALKEKHNIQDKLHPNKEGYGIIVKENILPVLEKVLES
jgi:acyl-CoA thioesterase-1